MINWLSINCEWLVDRELLSWSIDYIVLFIESRSQNINEFFVDAWIVETESESARISLDWILLFMLRVGCRCYGDSLSLTKRKQVLVVVEVELCLFRDVLRDR